MRRSAQACIWLFILLTYGCGSRQTGMPDNVSEALPSERVSLGGFTAARLSADRTDDGVFVDTFYTIATRIKALDDQAGEIRRNRRPLSDGSFYDNWKALRQLVTENFEHLRSKDMNIWMLLNDSLLKYSGEVMFADELERMVFNAPVKGVFTDETVKSFCYSLLYDRLYVNLLGSSSASYDHTMGGAVRVVQDTAYPYDGKIKLKVEVSNTSYINLFVRIPGWVRQGSVTVRGVRYRVEAGSYTEISRKWNNGDEVEIILEFAPVVMNKGQDSIAFTYGSFILGHLPAADDNTWAADSMVSEEQPAVETVVRTSATTTPCSLEYLMFVSPPGEMPTFTFSGLPETPFVLQPLFAIQRPEVWIELPRF